MPNTSEAKSVEKLIRFALKNNLIEDIDAIYSRNILIDLLEIEAPWEGGLEYEAPETAAPILTELLDIAVKKGIIENSVTERDLFDTRLMNAVMPRPSEVVSKFCAHKEKSLKDATDWFYKLNNDCEYIRRSRIAKNIKWVYKDDKYGRFRSHHKPLQTRKGPERNKKTAQHEKIRLPRLRAVRGKHGLCREAGPRRAPDAAAYPLHAEPRAVVHAVFALRLFQRALHSAKARALAHACKPRHTRKGL